MINCVVKCIERHSPLSLCLSSLKSSSLCILVLSSTSFLLSLIFSQGLSGTFDFLPTGLPKFISYERTETSSDADDDQAVSFSFSSSSLLLLQLSLSKNGRLCMCVHVERTDGSGDDVSYITICPVSDAYKKRNRHSFK